MKQKIMNTAENMSRHKHLWTENLSYKIVALFVSLILWISILGRRDFVGTKEVDLQFTTSENVVVMSQSSDKVRLKISGPQPVIKKFKEKISLLKLDATDYPTGQFEFDINLNQFDIPKGIKILSVKPNTVKVELVQKN